MTRKKKKGFLLTSATLYVKIRVRVLLGTRKVFKEGKFVLSSATNRGNNLSFVDLKGFGEQTRLYNLAFFCQYFSNCLKMV